MNRVRAMWSRRTIARTMLVIALGLAASVPASGQEAPRLDQYGRWVNGISEPWMFSASLPKENVNLVQQKWSAIESENKAAVEKQWSGKYFTGGDTHGSYLRWSKQNGFVLMHVDKCAAQVMGFSYGKVVFTSILIQFMPEATVSSQTRHEHSMKATRFLPVTWRSDRYLVPEDEIADFGDYIAGLGKYNDWAGNHVEVVEFFAKLDQESAGTLDQLARPSRIKKAKAKMDLPKVPSGFERFMKKPIDIRITTVGKAWLKLNGENPWWNDLIIPTTINAGQAEGVRPRMIFRTDSDETIVASKVGSHSSEAIVVRSVRKRPCVRSKDDDCGEIIYSPIRVGLRASTSSFRYE